MKALEEEQLREEAALLKSPAGSPPAEGVLNAFDGAITAPSSPPAKGLADSTKPLPIGPPSGVKSMPASRRPSGGSKDDLSYHLSKLSITPGPLSAALALSGSAERASLEANMKKSLGYSSGKFGFDDESSGPSGELCIYPAFHETVSPFNPSLPFRSGVPASKGSASNDPNAWMFSGASARPIMETQTVPLTGRPPSGGASALNTAAAQANHHRGSPPHIINLSDPLGSTLPSLNARSVPGTPQGGFSTASAVSRERNAHGGLAGAQSAFAASLNPSGIASPASLGGPGNGLDAAQRGYSNPDLTKVFGRALGSGFPKAADDFGSSLHDDVCVFSFSRAKSIG